MRPGVAAGHPATAAIGAEILADGGTAADAVVAMALASCVAETVMSGLLAGCHAVVFDGSRVMNLDGFAAVPSGRGDVVELPIAFGDEHVVYSIGPASCAVPGGYSAMTARSTTPPLVESTFHEAARSATERTFSVSFSSRKGSVVPTR